MSDETQFAELLDKVCFESPLHNMWKINGSCEAIQSIQLEVGDESVITIYLGNLETAQDIIDLWDANWLTINIQNKAKMALSASFSPTTIKNFYKPSKLHEYDLDEAFAVFLNRATTYAMKLYKEMTFAKEELD